MSKKKGGYKIIDLQGLEPLINESIQVKGLYESLENNYQKNILVTGIVINGIERPDVNTEVKIDNDSFIFNIYNKQVRVENNDDIYFEEITLYAKRINLNNSYDEDLLSQYYFSVSDEGNLQLRYKNKNFKKFKTLSKISFAYGMNEYQINNQFEFDDLRYKLFSYDTRIYLAAETNIYTYGNDAVKDNYVRKRISTLTFMNEEDVEENKNVATLYYRGAEDSEDYRNFIDLRFEKVRQATFKGDNFTFDLQRNFYEDGYSHFIISDDGEYDIIDIDCNSSYSNIEINSSTTINGDKYINDFIVKQNLYYHNLTITCGTSAEYYLMYPIYGNNTPVDSLQDLTTLTHAKEGTKLMLGTTYLIFNNNVWKDKSGNLATAVNDSIETHY